MTYLRVSLTERCNLRCRYCLPERARFAPQSASGSELRSLVRAICQAVTVSKIRFTGGEPGLVDDLVAHVANARGLVQTIGLTSNGTQLAGRLAALRAAGLQRLNLSLDAADAAGFRAVTRRDGFEQVLACLATARALGFAPLKLNAVALASTDAAGLVALALREGVHLRFIELMEIGEARSFYRDQHVTAAWLQECLFLAGYSLAPDPRRDEPTSRVWVLPGVDPEQTTIGFITTVSDPFCATCDRLRLTSAGRLHTCLFEPSGVDLLTPLRSDNRQALRRTIQAAVAAKERPQRYIRTGVMAAIGG